MTQPLAPLSLSGQNQKAPTAFTRTSSYKTSTSVLSHTFAMEQEEENSFIDLMSSPFVTKVNESRRSSTKGRSPSKHPSPRKQIPDGEPGQSLTESALRENEEQTESTSIPDSSQEGSILYSDNGYDSMSIIGEARAYNAGDETTFSTFSAVPNTDMTLITKTGKSRTKSASRSPSKSTRHRDGTRTPAQSRPTTPGTTVRKDTDVDLSSASPTPRPPLYTDSGDTTNLLDFTGQFNDFAPPSPSRDIRHSHKKFNTQPDLASYASGLRGRSPEKKVQPPHTPSEGRHFGNLLDFDIPPAPTPRSVPTITIRELESLKATFASQISQLKATLNGRETEINNLKTSIDDAECRVGQAMEAVREHRDAKEGLEADKVDWDRRDKEMQSVLRDVKKEIVHGEHERSELTAKFEEVDKRREEAEARASEAESKLAGIEAGTSAANAQGDVSTPGTGSNKAVEVAVERVARELHTLYKAKHETKVTALKKSYEARWEKRIRELQGRVDTLTKENDDLRIERDATMSGVIPSRSSTTVDSTAQTEDQESQDKKEKEESTARLLRLEQLEASHQKNRQELQRKLDSTIADFIHTKKENEELHEVLGRERLERGDLVAAVEELLSLQQQKPPPSAPPSRAPSFSDTHSLYNHHRQGSPPPPPHPPAMTTSVSESSFSSRGSGTSAYNGSGHGHGHGHASGTGTIPSRASGLKGPGFGASATTSTNGESRIGALHKGMRSVRGSGSGYGYGGIVGGGGGSGGSGTGFRSGIMSNIERMGRGRGGGVANGD